MEEETVWFRGVDPKTSEEVVLVGWTKSREPTAEQLAEVEALGVKLAPAPDIAGTHPFDEWLLGTVAEEMREKGLLDE